MKRYKVWVEIEEIDEEEGTYEDLNAPRSTITEYNTLEEAVAVQHEIVSYFEGYEPVLKQ